MQSVESATAGLTKNNNQNKIDSYAAAPAQPNDASEPATELATDAAEPATEPATAGLMKNDNKAKY